GADRRTVTGGYAAPPQGRNLERHRLVDLHDRTLVHHHVGRERPQQRHREDVFAAGLDPERAVGYRCAVEQPRTGGPQIAADRMNDTPTWSPGAMSSTPGPTSVTMPAPSWPPRTGKPPIGMPPVTRWWSEWHMPAASIWILTSSFCGSPISISSIDQGWLNSQISAPLFFTLNLLSSLNVGLARPQLHASNRLVECRSAGDPGHQGSRMWSPDGDRSLSQRVVAGQ